MERKKDQTKSQGKLPDIEDLVQPDITTVRSNHLARQRWKHYNTVIKVTCAECGSCTTTNCMKTMRSLTYCPSCNEELDGSPVFIIRRAICKVINSFPYKSDKHSLNDCNDLEQQHPPPSNDGLYRIEGGCSSECNELYLSIETKRGNICQTIPLM
jgi:predicted Zn-ribbon and HTH transcriptional regulator